METIIQQITIKLAKKITENALEGKIYDIDSLASQTLEDCKQASIEIIEEIVKGLNQDIREDKRGRKEKDLVLKEKDRPRQLITELGNLEKRPNDKEKESIRVLHIYADEDHVHMQKEKKEKGKKNKIVPIVTVTEGTIEESKGRNRTINPIHFVDEKFKSKELWASVEGYIANTYKLEDIEKIYLHGDGGKWIKKWS